MRRIETMVTRMEKTAEEWRNASWTDSRDAAEPEFQPSKKEWPEVCPPSALPPHQFVLFRFGLALAQLLTQMGLVKTSPKSVSLGSSPETPPSVVRIVPASSLPANLRQSSIAYRNSYL